MRHDGRGRRRENRVWPLEGKRWDCGERRERNGVEEQGEAVDFRDVRKQRREFREQRG